MKLNFKNFNSIQSFLKFKKAIDTDYDELEDIGYLDPNIQKILEDESVSLEQNQLLPKNDVWDYKDDSMSMDDVLSNLENFEMKEVIPKIEEKIPKKNMPSYDEVMELKNQGVGINAITRHFNKMKEYEGLDYKEISRIIDNGPKLELEPITRDKWKYIFDEIDKHKKDGYTNQQIADSLGVDERTVRNLLNKKTQILHGLMDKREETKGLFDYGAYVVENKDNIDPTSLAQKLGEYGPGKYSSEVNRIMRDLIDPNVAKEQKPYLYEELRNAVTGEDITKLIAEFARNTFLDDEEISYVSRFLNNVDSSIFDKLNPNADILNYIFGLMKNKRNKEFGKKTKWV